MKRYAFIYNPAAREGKSESKLVTLEQKVEQLPEAELFRSKVKGDIAELVDQLKDDFDVFVACGGDGTVREIASELISTGKTMGIIPMGTGNDLCKTLKIPRDLQKSFEIVIQGQSQKIDVGRCNDWIFLNSLGFGFDGLTNRFAFEMKKLPVLLRYATAALKAAIYQKPFRAQITTDNSTFRQQLIMAACANGRVEGGAFWIAPQASVTDGKLNFITVKPVKRWLIPILLPLFLIKKPAWIPYINSIKTDEIELEFEDTVVIHADGDVLIPDKKEFSISLVHKGLSVICRL